MSSRVFGFGLHVKDWLFVPSYRHLVIKGFSSTLSRVASILVQANSYFDVILYQKHIEILAAWQVPQSGNFELILYQKHIENRT